MEDNFGLKILILSDHVKFSDFFPQTNLIFMIIFLKNYFFPYYYLNVRVLTFFSEFYFFLRLQI